MKSRSIWIGGLPHRSTPAERRLRIGSTPGGRRWPAQAQRAWSGGDSVMHGTLNLPARPQGLIRDPFMTRPSPDLFFSSSVHRAAAGFVYSALKSGAPYILVTGDFGAGKTMLSLKLVRALSPCVYMSTPAQSYAEVLRRAHVALGLPDPTAGDRSPEPETLYRSLYAHLDAGPETRRLFLVVEDPQDLDPKTLEWLLDLPHRPECRRAPICLILFAHTSFPGQLRTPPWRPFDARITQRHHLPGLDERETRAYIAFRLEHARDPASPAAVFFEEAALQRVYALSGGNPRDINNLCGTCLSIAGNESLVRIDPKLVARAARVLGRSEGDADRDSVVIELPARIRRMPRERETPDYLRDAESPAPAPGGDAAPSCASDRAASDQLAGGTATATATPSPSASKQDRWTRAARGLIGGLPVPQLAAGLAIIAASLYLAWPHFSGDPESAGGVPSGEGAVSYGGELAQTGLLTQAERRELEALLQRLDFETGPVDGAIDPRTRRGIAGYQQMAGRTPADGEASRALLEELRAVGGGDAGGLGDGR
jgi:type II secretory pathway predicted ATPase ExeA